MKKSIAMAMKAMILATATVLAVSSIAPGRERVVAPAEVEGWPSYSTIEASVLTRAGLPSVEMAKTVLSDALTGNIHPQWFALGSGPVKIRTFVVFPQRASTAPVVVLTSDTQGMSDWLRAVGDQVAGKGFIAVVPDLLSGMGPGGGGTEAFADQDSIFRVLAEQKSEIAKRRADVMDWAIRMPGSNGNGAMLGFNAGAGQARIDARIESPERLTATFELREQAWDNAVAFLARMETTGQPMSGARQAGSGLPTGLGAPEAETLAEFLSGGRTDRIPTRSKHLEFPANFLMAARVVADSPRRGEWIDIPMADGPGLRTWISYPQGSTSAPVVLVFQPGPGMDMGEPPQSGGGANWLRGIADQLAYEGFIALVPDLTSGLGPNGGNFDSFQYPDDVGMALGTLSREEILNRARVAHDYGLGLAVVSGTSAAIGFCFGGGLAWESTAELAGLDAGVVFYGGPPEEQVMARIQAPVAAYYGSNDVGLAPRIEGATSDMRRLGKEFEVEVYDEATHVFLYRQDLSKNSAATVDAWPKAIAFMKKHTM